jgi:hypothetical protein
MFRIQNPSGIANALIETTRVFHRASLFAVTHCRKQQPSKQPPNDFGLSDFERPIQYKFFVLLCPGGANPHDLAIGGF